MTHIEQPKDPPRLVFPCHYPIKVIGIATPDFKWFVTQVIQKHFPDFDEATMSVKDSAQSNYQSISATLFVEEETQIHPFFLDLKADYRVKIVL